MNFLIDAESKRPSSGDPNPKGGNDPESTGNHPLVGIRLFAVLFLTLSLSLFFVFDCKWRPFFESSTLSLGPRDPIETGPLSLRSWVPTSPGERNTCNLLHSVFRRALYLRYVWPDVCIQGRTLIIRRDCNTLSSRFLESYARARSERLRVFIVDSPVNAFLTHLKERQTFLLKYLVRQKIRVYPSEFQSRKFSNHIRKERNSS